MSIKVKIKTVYGEERIYPICDKANAFASIAGTKTLTQQTIDQVKTLGYEIEIEQQTL